MVGVSGLDALLALVEEPQLGALVGVDDGQDLRDTLADVMDAGELGGGASGNLGGPELDQLPCACQHRVPECACARAATYDLSSESWVARSSLDLFQSWAVFCGGCKYADERCGRCERACGCTYDLGLRLQRHVSTCSSSCPSSIRHATTTNLRHAREGCGCSAPLPVYPPLFRSACAIVVVVQKARASTYHFDCSVSMPGVVDWSFAGRKSISSERAPSVPLANGHSALVRAGLAPPGNLRPRL